MTLRKRSFDLIQWPVESSAAIHVLAPGSLFLDVDPAFLVAFHWLAFAGAKAAESHHGHHGLVVVVDGVHALFRDG